LKYKISIFFTIGLVLYLIDTGLNSYNDKEIYISDQEIISLINAWKSQVGRNPNDDEIARIINNLVEEEILYREALLLGLDAEDKIIKRRLAQKISFLKQESIANNFSKEEIKEYFNNNKDKYYIDTKYTFTHYFFSLENNSKDRSQDSYQGLINKLPVNSDVFFLGKNFVDMSKQDIENDFGNNFSSHFDNIELNNWIAPIESAFGHHIIFVSKRVDGYYPDILTVLKQVEVDLLQSKRDKAIKNFIDEIKINYKVFINPELQI
jgi:hypothetical protein